MSVNVSPRQFKADGFAEVVQRCLHESGLDPGRLEIELAESALAKPL